VTVHVTIRGPALKAHAIVKIERLNGTPRVVRQSIRRRTIPATFGTVTLPALHPLENSLAILHSLRRDGWLVGYLNRFARLFGLPTRGEGFDISHQVGTILLPKWTP